MPQNSRNLTKTIQSTHPSKAFQQLDVMRRDGRFTDITLVAEGKKFHAHKAVLCACSPYFDRMFQPGFIEQENKEVTLQDFEPGTLGLLLDFMYTAKITLNEENAQDILIGANMLMLYEVREAAGNVLGQLIDHNNVLIIRSLASVFSCRDVEAKAHNFLLERFELVSKTEEFLKLSSCEVLKFLSMDEIMVKSEESIFECIIRWIEVDRESRSKHFDELISAVRFPLLSEHFLNSEMISNEYFKKSEVCQELAQEARDLKSKPDALKSLASKAGDRLVPQYRGSNQLLFLQCSNIYPLMKTPPVLFDFKKTSWTSLPGPTNSCKSREASSYLFHENFIFSLGGEYNSEPSDNPAIFPPIPGFDIGNDHTEIRIDSEVYCFSLHNKTWSVHSNMLTKRKRHQAVLLDSKIYVTGGTNECSRTLDTVEVLDLRSPDCVWVESRPMLSRRVSHGAVVLNGCIYVVGGWDGQGVVKSVERYSPESGLWEEVSTYSHMRMKSGVAVMDGKVYVVGGCLQTLESCYKADVWDPVTRQWASLPDTSHSRATPVLVPHRGKLYVFGGEGNSQGVVECFDPFTNKWSVVQDTRIKHFVNGAYGGCLVDKPWDWDIQKSRENNVNSNMQRLLSVVGLDVVQTVRSLGVYGQFDN